MGEAVAFGKERVCVCGFAFEGFTQPLSECGHGVVEEEVDPRAERVKFGNARPQEGLDARQICVGVRLSEVVVGGVPGFLIEEMEGKELFDFGERIFSIESEKVLFGHAGGDLELPPTFDIAGSRSNRVEGLKEGFGRLEGCKGRGVGVSVLGGFPEGVRILGQFCEREKKHHSEFAESEEFGDGFGTRRGREELLEGGEGTGASERLRFREKVWRVLMKRGVGESVHKNGGRFCQSGSGASER